MPEQNMTPNDPNNPTNPNAPPWSADPDNSRTNPQSDSDDLNSPQGVGQTSAGGSIDVTTGIADPNERPGYQGSRNPQPGGPNGGPDAGPNAGSYDPDAGAGNGEDMGAGLGGSGSGYGGPVSPGGEADMPSTDPGQAGNASWAGQGQGAADRRREASQGDTGQDNVNTSQPDTGYVNRPGSDQDGVSDASRDSFPASDSPSYNPGRP